ncbi:MAG TPA: peptide ABC transporter substrate-binding protein [Ktedonobacteraceae bacterium]|nr:peptide ABC transporter substrate-binding protein [Ktedonobacteraceae bacterium]
MHRRLQDGYLRRDFLNIWLAVLCALVIAACGGGNTTTPEKSNTPGQAFRQVLTFPNVGTTDVAALDPTRGVDQNSGIAVNMIYSGLVRADQNLNVVPDQASWESTDNKVYTFTLKSGITFSDGTPVTAQTYVDSWTRALLPSVASPVAPTFEAPIVGADDVANGKSKVLTGLKAVNEHTLQVTLKRPTSYFLQALTNNFFFPINSRVIARYGEKNWAQYIAGNGVGTGPLMVKEWQHNVKLVLVPNPHYYGDRTRLAEVDMLFVNDPVSAFKSYRAGQYDFVWNLAATDQQIANTMPGFIRKPLLQTDVLFFDNSKPPFNNTTVRQAFAYATDKQALVHAVFKDSVGAAPTILPPGMTGYQPDYQGLSYNPERAKALLQSVYPDVTKMPTITFSYPSSQVSSAEAAALQQMWQSALDIQVKTLALELNTYNQMTANHQVQFGFIEWTADFPDPYDWLTLNLVSTVAENAGQWHNPQFDQLVAQAEATSGDARIMLYNKAEQVAVTDVGWLPLDHPMLAAVIPPRVHGVSINGNGLYFGDWSGVSLSPR